MIAELSDRRFLVRRPTEWACPMDRDEGDLHRTHPENVRVLAETELCRISAWSEAVLPGYACVLSKRHVIEPFELAEDEQASFFLDAMATSARPCKPVRLGEDELRDPWKYASSPPYASVPTYPWGRLCRIPEPLPGTVHPYRRRDLPDACRGPIGVERTTPHLVHMSSSAHLFGTPDSGDSDTTWQLGRLSIQTLWGNVHMCGRHRWICCDHRHLKSIWRR